MITALKGMIVPPISLLLLVLAGLAVGLRWRRLGWLMNAVGAVGLLVLAMPITSGMMLAALEAELPRRIVATAPPEAVVILSAEARPIDPARGIYAPGPMTLERLAAGVQIARASRLPVLVAGGVMRPGAQSLADIMAENLQENWNIPVRWREGRSRNTWENAEYSAEILRAAGVSRVYLVSHSWHLRRAIAAFARFGITATAVPVRLQPQSGPTLEDLVPTPTGWVASYHALHEWIGIAWYALQ